MKASVKWKEGMAFDASLDGFNFTIDAHPDFGGQKKGPMPKGLTLVSLAGCTAMDVISILGKMRINVDHFEVDTDARIAPEHPKKITEIVIKYIFKGENLPLEKLEHAITLSYETYCGVIETLRSVVKLSYEIYINDKKVR